MNHILNGILLCAGAFAALGCQSGVLTAPPLAVGQYSVNALISDGNNVYWTSGEGFVRSVSTAGGAVAEVAQGLTFPVYIALDNDAVYWSDSGTIARAPKAGGATEMLFENEDGVGALQVDDTSLYWLRGIDEVASIATTGQVRTAPKLAASAVQTLFSDSVNPNALALNGTLYFGAQLATPEFDGFGLAELPTSGGTPVAPVAVASGNNTASYGANVCTSGIDAQAQSLDANTTLEAITCSALDGTNPNVVAAGLTAAVMSLTLDDTTVYFNTADGAMSAVSLDGTTPIVTGATTSPDNDTVVGATPSAGNGPVTFATGPGSASVAVDTTQVYWAHNAGNAVFAMPKF
jgi:hypothetical protein